MSQHDYVIDDQPGSTFLPDLNAALAAAVSLNSGATAPATTYAYQLWADTSTGYLKIRNAANSGWVTAFKLSDMSMTAGDLAYTGTLTGGTGVINIGSGQIYKDAAGNIGIGTLTGASKFNIAGNMELLGPQSGTLASVVGFLKSIDGTQVGYWGFGTTTSAFQFVNNKANGYEWYDGGVLRTVIDSNGNLLVKSASGLGYGSGAGGTATQPTSKTSAVTLSKPTGQITLNNSSLAAGATAFFTINNSLITDKDTPTITRQSGGTNQAYQFGIDSVATGSCVAWVKNITAGALAEAPIVNFNLNRGSAT